MLHPTTNLSGPSVVLSVDDDAQIRNLLRTGAAHGNYQVLAASNGGEALQISESMLVHDASLNNGFGDGYRERVRALYSNPAAMANDSCLLYFPVTLRPGSDPLGI